MTAFGKVVGLMLILMAVASSTAWRWPETATPLHSPANQLARLSAAGTEAEPPLFVTPRGTAIELTWLGRRVACMAVPACASDLFAAESIPPGFGEPATSTGPGPAGSSLVSLRTQLTI